MFDRVRSSEVMTTEETVATTKTPVETLKDDLRQLAARRIEWEAEVAAAVSFLECTPVGLKGRLVDSEGFPRDDVDLFAVRQARNTVACRTNDLKHLMAELQTKLAASHEATRTENLPLLHLTTGANVAPPLSNGALSPSGSVDVSPPSNRAEAARSAGPRVPIAVVRDVAQASPAADARLCVGDRICDFGRVNAGTFSRGLRDIGDEAANNRGMPVTIRLLRERVSGRADEVLVTIVPQRWSGSGLLGCVLESLVGGS